MKSIITSLAWICSLVIIGQTSREHFGEMEAAKHLSKFCGNEQQGDESLDLDWPKSENWMIGSNQETKHRTRIELIHTNETLENWTEFGCMMSIKDDKKIPLDNVMNLTLIRAKENCPLAKLTFIEKDESVEYPWIIFTIEVCTEMNKRTGESQLWYIVQGNKALYTNFRAIKEREIPADLKAKWIKFFKTGKIEHQ